MEEKPFEGLKISSSDFLNTLENRTICPKCMKSRKFYCYNCFVPVKGIEDLIPRVQLPIKIDIIKHQNECDGKSTSAHAAVLAPDDVRVFTYPCIPDYPDPSKVVLVFPGKNSLTLEELARNSRSKPKDRDNNSDNDQNSCRLSSEVGQNESLCKNLKGNNPVNGSSSDKGSNPTSEEPCSKETASCQVLEESSPYKRKAGDTEGEKSKKQKISSGEPPFERAIFIDSTWKQTKGIIADDRLKDMTCIQLKSRETKFWRHQKDNPATYLSTIEAVYYLVRDYHELFLEDTSYNGEYDNLLFFFSFMYQKIRTFYDGGKDLKAYKQRAKTKQICGEKTSE